MNRTINAAGIVVAGQVEQRDTPWWLRAEDWLHANQGRLFCAGLAIAFVWLT